MANASWLDPDGNMFFDSDERLMAPGSRRLWPCEVEDAEKGRYYSDLASVERLRREAEGDAVTLAGHRYIVEQAVLDRLRREAAELVARNDAAMSPPVPLWMDAMRRAYARRGPQDGGAT